ncbi:MAG: YpdA family putative bacillithiol disulfide reductase [Clostridiales bacterium]|nr:YpdA family putative bacillithiol disulfide reductase [Clostridiales bacterium]
MLDLAIVGAGPSGLSVGLAAQKKGLSYVIFDKGGVVEGLRRVPLHMTFSSTADRLELEGFPFLTHGPRPTRQEILNYYRTVAERAGLQLALYRKVLAIHREGEGFLLKVKGTLSGKEEEARARGVVVATGYFDHPRFLGVPGEDLPKVSHYFTEGHPFFGLEVAVVGGQNSAAEAALELFRAGARVTLIHRGEGLSPKVKPWVRPDVESRIEKGDIRAYFGTRVKAIEPERLLLVQEGKEFSIPNDYVFALTGYWAEAPLLQDLGVPRDPLTGIPAHDPETLATPIPGVYVAGVVAAGYDANKIFIETSRYHGEKIVAHFVKERGGLAWTRI